MNVGWRYVQCQTANTNKVKIWYPVCVLWWAVGGNRYYNGIMRWYVFAICINPLEKNDVNDNSFLLKCHILTTNYTSVHLILIHLFYLSPAIALSSLQTHRHTHTRYTWYVNHNSFIYLLYTFHSINCIKVCFFFSFEYYFFYSNVMSWTFLIISNSTLYFIRNYSWIQQH